MLMLILLPELLECWVGLLPPLFIACVKAPGVPYLVPPIYTHVCSHTTISKKLLNKLNSTPP